MDTIFMNSENKKTSASHRLLLNVSDKINLKKSDKYVALSNPSMYFTWKNIKSYKKAINLKYLLQRRGMINLNYQMDILYHIFKVISSIFSKNLENRLIILQKEYMQIK